MATEPERLIVHTPAYIIRNLGADILIGLNVLKAAGLSIDTTTGRPTAIGKANVFLTDLNPLEEHPNASNATTAKRTW